jgi:hypothetical protein
MSEINKATELSEQELDTVAGGFTLEEFAAFNAEKNTIKSSVAATPFGAFSQTDVQDVDVASEVQKFIDA